MRRGLFILHLVALLSLICFAPGVFAQQYCVSGAVTSLPLCSGCGFKVGDPVAMTFAVAAREYLLFLQRHQCELLRHGCLQRASRRVVLVGAESATPLFGHRQLQRVHRTWYQPPTPGFCSSVPGLCHPTPAGFPPSNLTMTGSASVALLSGKSAGEWFASSFASVTCGHCCRFESWRWFRHFFGWQRIFLVHRTDLRICPGIAAVHHIRRYRAG